MRQDGEGVNITMRNIEHLLNLLATAQKRRRDFARLEHDIRQGYDAYLAGRALADRIDYLTSFIRTLAAAGG